MSMFTPSQVEPVRPGAATIEPVTVDTGKSTYTPPALTPGSATAKALYAVWAGHPIVTVASPPGGGKSTLIVDLLAHLGPRAGLTIHVGCPTNAQVRSLRARLDDELPKELHSGIKVTTLASAGMVRKGAMVPSGDLFVVDEGYQASFADVIAASRDKFAQILLVGDPGQIGPVVSQNVSAFSGQRSKPHGRAMDVFRARPDAVNIEIDGTYRFGEATVAAIAPLYDFPFISRRPDRHLLAADGTVLPELFALPVDCESVVDGTLGVTIRNRVRELLLTRAVDDGVVGQLVQPREVAVVVARNSQRQMVEAMLGADNLDEVTVGTSDSLQGGQWRAVVALDPFAGSNGITDHTASPGRTCVMASRHTTHLTWVFSPDWRDLVTSAGDSSTIATAMAVRDALTKGAAQ